MEKGLWRDRQRELVPPRHLWLRRFPCEASTMSHVADKALGLVGGGVTVSHRMWCGQV